ncbi:transcriptional regulator [Moraxella sp. Pampa]|uniref:transcriptional regulator n=1 Tax=Moraxella sp. Pampa TaxID=3111978 RepID=UPI002B4142FC|nr:YdaS family helix-turn-helix protein [Moraxella sp. Pampa]
MNKNPTIGKLITEFGNQVKLAKKVGVKQGTVTGWLNNRHGMREIYALKVEKLTNGKFKAADLCPKLKELESL